MPLSAQERLSYPEEFALKIALGAQNKPWQHSAKNDFVPLPIPSDQAAVAIADMLAKPRDS
jgi:hypothetical protein